MSILIDARWFKFRLVFGKVYNPYTDEWMKPGFRIKIGNYFFPRIKEQ